MAAVSQWGLVTTVSVTQATKWTVKWSAQVIPTQLRSWQIIITFLRVDFPFK